MLKVGLLGFGGMGHGHFAQYLRLMQEGAPVKLVALCDVNEKQFVGRFTGGNLDVGRGAYDYSQFHLYTDFDEMLAGEELDYIDIALPTYLHSYYTIKALNAGLHVLCEKPMALNPTQCRMMIDASRATGKKLMIAQCLRFWPAYETLKHYVESGEFGKPVLCYFFRGGGGGWPKWSFQDWMLDEQRAGGSLLDQHVHDVDMVNWLFGMPEAVSCLGRNVVTGQGFDAVTTQYRYDGFAVTTADDWSINSREYPFVMTYRANFEKGCVEFKDDKCMVYPLEGGAFEADNCGGEAGYYREIRYFIDAILNDTPIETSDVESTYRTICLATAELESARSNGEWTAVRY